MYVYLITNKVNNKKYVGITNNYKKRWANHKSNNNPSMAIAKAIKKYGVKNFTFEIVEENVPLDDIDAKEQYYIEYYNTHVSTNKGYNISKGGRYNIANSTHIGVKNGRALLSKEQVEYIKSHRNIPEYVLYDEFSEILTYTAFRDIYLDKTYKDITPTVDIYPNNFEFSCQFNRSKITYDEVVELRQKYKNNIFWKDAYTDYYKTLYDEMTFWNIYVGNRFKLVNPEVFTPERKHYQSMLSHSGENNGRAKLKKEDVLSIRYLFKSNQKTRAELQEKYSYVSKTTINNVINYKTWKNI